MDAETRSKSRSSKLLRILLLTTGIILLSLIDMSVAAQDDFSPLRRKLMDDGFKAHEIRHLNPPGPELMYKTVSQALRIREGKLSYAQFMEPVAIAKAQQFRRMHGPLLSEAETIYGVDHRVIVAILLVETRFGSYTGKTPTLSILATYALMDQKTHRDRVWSLLPPKDKKRWDRAAFDRKLMDRSKWAYQELCSLLRLAETQTVQIHSCRGSVMGAIGWAQFLPSSLVRYGVDADRDGRIDLFEPADAIFSVANYLKGYGWNEARNEAGKEEVIYAYNHSRPYVQTILGVAARLKP